MSVACYVLRVACYVLRVTQHALRFHQVSVQGVSTNAFGATNHRMPASHVLCQIRRTPRFVDSLPIR